LTQINIYPNPASEILHIEYYGNEQLSAEIINITGSIIYSAQNIPLMYAVNISKFASGAYVLKLVTVKQNVLIVFVKE